MHILLIEDDIDLGRSLQAALRTEGITSEWRRRVVDAPLRLDNEPWDAVLLDISLPDGNGLQLLEGWRRQGHSVPILMITARGTLHDRLLGLDGGADDYLVKPFDPAELVSRLRAVLRRTARQTSAVWTFGALRIFPERFEAELHGIPVALTQREFQILRILASDPDKVMAKDLLARKVAPLEEALDFATLEVHLSKLRRKVGAERIRTVRGVGYQWVSSPND